MATEITREAVILSVADSGGSVGSMDPPLSSQLIIIHAKLKAIINYNFPGQILRPSCASHKLNLAYARLCARPEQEVLMLHKAKHAH